MSDEADSDKAARRLLRAITAEPEAGEHEPIQALLPEFVEAEMAGDDVATLFPQVQAHLDTCDICGSLHAEMLDLLLVDAAPETELAAAARPARKRSLSASAIARSLVADTLAALGQSQGEIDGAMQRAFGARPLRGHAVAETAAQSYAGGQADRYVTAAYGTLQAVIKVGAGRLRAQQAAGEWPARLEIIARDQAWLAHLSPAAADAFAAAVAAQFTHRFTDMIALAKTH